MTSIWGSIVGHEVILRRLEQEVARERVAQVYLFTGPADLGKVTTALGLAQRLNCSGPRPPCGQCEGCLAVAHRVPTHVQLLEPEEMGGSGPVKVRIHKIETIRRLQAEISLKAMGHQTRVCIVRNAQAMKEETANTWLKTLEEPPPRVVLVLTSEQPAALLPTILSRARRYDFGPVGVEATADWLASEHQVAELRAAVAARSAAGRPGRALRLATDELTAQRRAEVLDLAAGLGQQPAAAAVAVAQRLLGGDDQGGGERLELALDFLEWWYRDALVWRAAGPAVELVNQDRQEAVRAVAERWSGAELQACLTALQQARMALRRQGNPQLVLEVLWLRLARGGRAAGGVG